MNKTQKEFPNVPFTMHRRAHRNMCKKERLISSPVPLAASRTVPTTENAPLRAPHLALLRVPQLLKTRHHRQHPSLALHRLAHRMMHVPHAPKLVILRPMAMPKAVNMPHPVLTPRGRQRPNLLVDERRARDLGEQRGLAGRRVVEPVGDVEGGRGGMAPVGEAGGGGEEVGDGEEAGGGVGGLEEARGGGEVLGVERRHEGRDVCVGWLFRGGGGGGGAHNSELRGGEDDDEEDASASVAAAFSTEALHASSVHSAFEDSRGPATLPATLARLIRAAPAPVPEAALVADVGKVYAALRKPDGTKYTGNLERAVRGSLCSTGLFERNGEGAWGLKVEATRQYEERLRERRVRMEEGRELKRKERGVDGAGLGNGGGGGGASGATPEDGGEGRVKRKYVRKNPGTPRLKKGAKREAVLEMLAGFSANLRAQPPWQNCFADPFKAFKGSESEDEAWKKLGNDRFVFMLQMYSYFQDIIEQRHAVAEILDGQKAKSAGKAASGSGGAGGGGGGGASSADVGRFLATAERLEGNMGRLSERLEGFMASYALGNEERDDMTREE
eukprot:CAMPEP_0184717342 /NCGR_PEP_ID=MMETSP0314-20130426/6836_1 /TAXON_ID=38298 /ORGANISM="Rhodella maculata, Strain CCMP 736" /LENGTH=558 /DNA_ID=CAMNT_0027180889 /DNA_START=109 /DNA_END=1786 /DNA_ORIENTATION=-